MLWPLIAATAWVATAVFLALTIGRAVRIADTRSESSS